MRDNKNNTGFHKLLLSFQTDRIKANIIPITRYISSSFNDSILSGSIIFVVGKSPIDIMEPIFV